MNKTAEPGGMQYDWLAHPNSHDYGCCYHWLVRGPRCYKFWFAPDGHFNFVDNIFYRGRSVLAISVDLAQEQP
jgi:hypothetical protein